MRNFSELTERDLLALAISSEEEDGRVYADFAHELRDEYPGSAKMFSDMAAEENEHRRKLMDVFADLRSVGCDMLTLGQYLQPTPEHLPVERYVTPEEFDEIGEMARKLGFGMVASGPFVRSSYHAGEMADQLA